MDRISRCSPWEQSVLFVFASLLFAMMWFYWLHQMVTSSTHCSDVHEMVWMRVSTKSEAMVLYGKMVDWPLWVRRELLPQREFKYHRGLLHE